MREFTSNLAPKLKDFLSYKNALGIKYETSRVYLLQLDRYNLEHGNNSSLTKPTNKKSSAFSKNTVAEMEAQQRDRPKRRSRIKYELV